MIESGTGLLISMLPARVSWIKAVQEAPAMGGCYLGFPWCYWKKQSVLWGKVKADIYNLGFH